MTNYDRGNQPERPDSSPVTKPMPKEKRAEVSVTLTDAEREAVEWCVSRPQTHWQHGIYAATLRGLLERLGGSDAV